MNELTTAVKIALANIYVMYFKDHAYHWNVEGPNFSDYHGYFATVYGDVYGSVDPMAENLRKLGAYAPFSLDNLFSSKTATEDLVMPTTYNVMFGNLLVANAEVIAALNKVYELATAANEQGIANFVAERIDTHKMHAWQLKSLSKNVGA
jgi:starvation-inducible DNA-binding protein